jgi:hypothetical protein
MMRTFECLVRHAAPFGGCRLDRLPWPRAAVGFSVYPAGFIASFWLPEPRQEELPE